MNSERKPRKPPVKLEFHFPMYPLGTALEVTEKIETQGNGSLSESTLAMSMGMSVKSSGFQLKVLTAKQFGLVVKRGDLLGTTDLAKAIFKPTSETEKLTALAKAFYQIQLFKAVGERYKGTPLPSEEVLRNILEREFKVPSIRVADAHSKLITSAKTAGLLQESQGKTYLLTEEAALSSERAGMPSLPGGAIDTYKPPPLPPPGPGRKSYWEIRIDSKDFAGMDPAAIKAALDGFAELARILKSEESEGG